MEHNTMRTNGEKMREFIQSVRYFLYLLHFVRGVFVVLIVMMLVCSALFMHTEGLPVGESLYTTAITALTIGYGDITPKTIAGRTLSIVIGFLGVLFTGLIVAVATRSSIPSFKRCLQLGW